VVLPVDRQSNRSTDTAQLVTKHPMNVYIPGYIPPVPDPRKDVQTLPKELMSSTPGMSGPMSIPTQNMSTPPVQTAPMSVPKAPVTPMVDPI